MSITCLPQVPVPDNIQFGKWRADLQSRNTYDHSRAKFLRSARGDWDNPVWQITDNSPVPSRFLSQLGSFSGPCAVLRSPRSRGLGRFATRRRHGDKLTWWRTHPDRVKEPRIEHGYRTNRDDTMSLDIIRVRSVFHPWHRTLATVASRCTL